MILAAALLLPGDALHAQDDGTPSIEDLTREYRERSEAAVEALRAEVAHATLYRIRQTRNERRV